MSWRAMMVIFLLILYAGIVLLLYAPEDAPGRDRPFILFIMLGILILSLILIRYWLIKPYRRCEREIRRVLDGYFAIEPPSDESSIYLTPFVEEAGNSVYQTLNSTQTVNLNKRQAQYLALQNQINPHFLYNTLDGIRSEALIAGLDSIADMTEALATFFRYTISNMENLVTVEQELDNCRNYFMIQQYRFGDRLGLKIDIEEDCNAYLLPKLTLQPILENSIIHGTEMKIGKGQTTIEISCTDLRLLIEVKDDGVGMDEETLERLNRRLDSGVENIERSQGGIALINVNNRIRLLFGQEYGVHVYSLKNVGTKVMLSLPAITEDPAKKSVDV